MHIVWWILRPHATDGLLQTRQLQCVSNGDTSLLHQFIGIAHWICTRFGWGLCCCGFTVSDLMEFVWTIVLISFKDYFTVTGAIICLPKWQWDHPEGCVLNQPVLNYTWGPLYQHGLTLIPAWISNHMHSKVWDELSINSQTSTVAPLKFGNG